MKSTVNTPLSIEKSVIITSSRLCSLIDFGDEVLAPGSRFAMRGPHVVLAWKSVYYID
ncbi:MAG: hypothetical protein MJZ03_01020 [archaeon]|nr:hypothetical protein [archaeon]